MGPQHPILVFYFGSNEQTGCCVGWSGVAGLSNEFSRVHTPQGASLTWIMAPLGLFGCRLCLTRTSELSFSD